MPLVAVLHTPFCPLDVSSSELHYFCDLINVAPGTRIHHRDAVRMLQDADCSLPVFDKHGDSLAMGPTQWQDHLRRLRGRILYPGESLDVPGSRAVGSGR